MQPTPDTEDPWSTRTRILQLAREEVLRAGWTAATSGRIAQRAGVSKALIHYHFPDKCALLKTLADKARQNLARRAGGQSEVTSSGNPIDGFNDWLEGEFFAQDVEVALQLRCADDPVLTSAAGTVLDAFRREIERRTEQIIDALDLRAAIVVPGSLLADLLATLVEGMVVDRSSDQMHRRRLVEALWLSILAMGG